MRNVPRWQAGLLAASVLAAAGFLFGQAVLLASGVVPLGYILYASLSTVPAANATLTAERQLSSNPPLPGEPVQVTMRVTNESDRTLPDVRLIDGVPSELAVVSGSDRCLTTLRPGETAEIVYQIKPRRGSYKFADAHVRLRSMSAATMSTALLSVTGTTSFDCHIPLDGLPVHQRTMPFVGSVMTSSGGAGHEFHSTREYRHGDPLSRIDWRRYAKTGELGTILFREQEASRVVVVVDGRSESAISSAPGRPDGRTLSAYAGIMAASALADTGHHVGSAGLGISGDRPGIHPGPPAFVEPDAGAATLARIALICDTVAAGQMTLGTMTTTAPASHEGAAGQQSVSTPAADGGHTKSKSSPVAGDAVDRLDALADRNTQFVVCSPIMDEASVKFVEGLRRRGFPLTVITPNVATADSVGSRIATVRRSARLTRLRRLDVSITDWDPHTPLQRALAEGLGEVIR